MALNTMFTIFTPVFSRTKASRSSLNNFYYLPIMYNGSAVRRKTILSNFQFFHNSILYWFNDYLHRHSTCGVLVLTLASDSS